MRAMRNRAAALVIATLVAAPALLHAQSYHVVKQTLLGGEGGWDYVTVDPDAHRVYIPRGTHVMVVDEQTHKAIADIPGMRGIHGVAIVPKMNRGFVTGNDPKATKVVGTIKYGGPLEAGVSDGKGTLFVNLVDSGEIAQVDAKTLSVKTTFSAKPCERGYGAAFDAAHRRLFVSCQGAKPVGVV